MRWIVSFALLVVRLLARLIRATLSLLNVAVRAIAAASRPRSNRRAPVFAVLAVFVLLAAVVTAARWSSSSTSRASPSGLSTPGAAPLLLTTQPRDPNKGRVVVDVIDAATLRLDDGRRVRQLGIAAPPPGSCGAAQADAATHSKIRTGGDTLIDLTFEPGATNDEFGNQWAYIWYRYSASDPPKDFGIAQIRDGWVTPYDSSPAGDAYKATVHYTDVYAANSTAGRFGAACQPTPSTGSSGSGPSVTINPDHDDHHLPDLPDGLLTGGFCRHHRWC